MSQVAKSCFMHCFNHSLLEIKCHAHFGALLSRGGFAIFVLLCGLSELICCANYFLALALADWLDLCELWHILWRIITVS